LLPLVRNNLSWRWRVLLTASLFCTGTLSRRGGAPSPRRLSRAPTRISRPVHGTAARLARPGPPAAAAAAAAACTARGPATAVPAATGLRRRTIREMEITLGFEESGLARLACWGRGPPLTEGQKWMGTGWLPVILAVIAGRDGTAFRDGFETGHLSHFFR
jgi:hypothetical protein